MAAISLPQAYCGSVLKDGPYSDRIKAVLVFACSIMQQVHSVISFFYLQGHPNILFRFLLSKSTAQ